MTAAAMAILVITIAALCAVIAHLMRKRVVAVLLIVLVGILAGNAPGTVGQWAQGSADWLYDLPAAVSKLLAS